MKKIQGVVNLLKPPGMTSHDAVDYIRKLLQVKKVGHTGTLDPAATGVLPICIGRATRLAEYTQEQVKRYRAEIILGTETDTQDLTGDVLCERECEVSERELSEASREFVGNINQIPPDYSAVRSGGRKSYELARKGEKAVKKPRKVNIEKIDICKMYDEAYPRAILDIVCSKGTYIRTVCSDIGKLLNTGGVLGFLVRTVSGSFELYEAFTIEEISSLADSGDFCFIRPMSDLVLHLPLLTIDTRGAKLLENGKQVEVEAFDFEKVPPGNEPVRIVCESQFIAVGIYEPEKGTVRPKKVFI